MMRLGDDADKSITMGDDMTRFRFADYAYIHVADQRIEGVSDLSGLVLPVNTGDNTFTWDFP